MEMERIMNASGKLMEAIADDSALQSVLMSDYSDGELQQGSVSTLLSDALKENLGSSKETQIKKAFASAITIAKQNGVLPSDMNFDNPLDIAKAVDMAVTRAKTAYQNGAGLMDATEVAEALIDKAATQLAVSVDKAFETGVANEVIANGVIAVCTYYNFPQAAEYKPLIKQTIKRIEPALRTVAQKGIIQCREFAKKAARSVVNAAKNYASKRFTKVHA